jgi:hypothetical protein
MQSKESKKLQLPFMTQVKTVMSLYLDQKTTNCPHQDSQKDNQSNNWPKKALRFCDQTLPIEFDHCLKLNCSIYVAYNLQACLPRFGYTDRLVSCEERITTAMAENHSGAPLPFVTRKMFWNAIEPWVSVVLPSMVRIGCAVHSKSEFIWDGTKKQLL